MDEIGSEFTSPLPEIQRTSTSINTKKKDRPIKRSLNTTTSRKKIRCTSPSSSKYSLSDITIIERSHGLVKDEQALRNPLNTSTALGPNYNCPHCEVSFYSGMKLKIHLLMEHLVENCMICDLLFMDEEEKLEHEGKVHLAKICEICHESFEEIVEHYKERHDAVICNYCNVLLHPSEHYFKHVVEHHCAKEEFVKLGELEDIGESRREVSAFFCKLCEKIRYRELFGHYSYYHKINIYYLAKVFEKRGLDLKLSNLEVDDKPKSTRHTGTCKVCSLVYTKHVPKAFHKVYCEGYTACPHCPKVFEIPETLNKHLTETHKPQTFTETCPLCEENNTEDHLISHKAPQLKPYLLESDFTCSLCSLTLPTNNTKDIFIHFKDQHLVSTIKILNLIGPRPSQSSDSDSDSDCSQSKNEEFRVDFNPKYVKLYFDPKSLRSFQEENLVSCEFCFTNFPNKLKLLGHFYDKHSFMFPEGVLDCSRCCLGRNFSMETHLEHFGEGVEETFECVKCYFKIEVEEARKHFLDAHGDSLEVFDLKEWGLRCRFCEGRFWREEEAEQHEVSEHLEESTRKEFLECFQCENTFTTLKSLQNHNLPPSTPFKEDPTCKTFTDFAYQCTICNKVFPSQPHLRDHFTLLHPKLTVVFCPDENCKRTFAQKKYAKLHFKNMHENRTGLPANYDCEICGRTFTNKKGYLLHTKNSHAKGFKCVICGEKFQMPEFRKHHYQTVHPGELVYECTECQKTFSSKSGLHIHTRLHNEFSSICSYCGKEFFRRDSYKEHLLIHIGPKHRCPYCPKIFTQKSNLRRHIRLHTGEKPYSCPHCPKKFSDKGACNSHISVHTRQEECFCEVCGKKFSKQQKLRYHMKRHTGEGLVTCDICHRGFTSQYDLRKHVSTHDQQTQIICQCGRGFSSEKYLRTHIKVVHDPQKQKKQNSKNVNTLYNNRIGRFNCFQCLICKNYYSARTTISKHLKKIHKIERKDYAQHIRHLDPEEESNFTRTVFEETINIKEEEENEESDSNEESFNFQQQQTTPTIFINQQISTTNKEETIDKPEANDNEDKPEEVNYNQEVNEKPENPFPAVTKLRNRKHKHPSRYCGVQTGC